MVKTVRLARRAEKSLRKVTRAVLDAADLWRGLVEEHGIHVVQKIATFRDHSLVGKLRKSGIRSVSLSYGYRLYYRIMPGHVEYVLIEEHIIMITKKSKGSSAAEFFEKSRGGPLTFGAALAGVRHVEGLSQVEFAKKLRVSTAHLCDLEKGRRFVSAERAAALAKRMGHPQAYWVKLAIQDQIDHAGLKLKVEVVAA